MILLIYACFCVVVAASPNFLPLKPEEEYSAVLEKDFVNESSELLRVKGKGVLLTTFNYIEDPVTFTFHVDNTTACISPFLNIYLGASKAMVYKVGLECSDEESWKTTFGEKIVEIDDSGKCQTIIKVSSKEIKLSSTPMADWEYDLAKPLGDGNISAISFAVGLNLNSCEASVDFKADFYLPVFAPDEVKKENEILTTTTQTTTIRTFSTSSILVTTLAESIENASLLWVIVFVFSGAFSAAVGGVCMFFFLRCKKQRSVKVLSGENEDVHTAIERNTTVIPAVPSDTKAAAP